MHELEIRLSLGNYEKSEDSMHYLEGLSEAAKIAAKFFFLSNGFAEHEYNDGFMDNAVDEAVKNALLYGSGECRVKFLYDGSNVTILIRNPYEGEFQCEQLLEKLETIRAMDTEQRRCYIGEKSKDVPEGTWKNLSSHIGLDMLSQLVDGFDIYGVEEDGRRYVETKLVKMLHQAVVE